MDRRTFTLVNTVQLTGTEFHSIERKYQLTPIEIRHFARVENGAHRKEGSWPTGAERGGEVVVEKMALFC